MQVIFAPLAETDLEEILEFIARDKPRAAVKFVERIRRTCERLGNRPHMGQARPEFAGGDLRAFPVGNYIIFYRVRSNCVEIARVLHGARDLDSLLG
jgi:toxin ParE1/3/4